MSNQVFVSVENLAPSRGTVLTPVWVGFHNGEFDTYDRGRPASPGLERVAEDGTFAGITDEFDQANFGETQGVVASAPIQVGDTQGAVFSLNVEEGDERYLNYAAMILPSNDFFIANGNPLAHEIFDENGNFIGADFVVEGSAVLDAGTEVNDEIPANTAFFGQASPDTGTPEGGVIAAASGFHEGGNILSDERFSNADFTAEGYQVARIRVLNAILGSNDDEILTGTAADDYISGRQGSDQLFGGAGNDIILGGAGNDLIVGQIGDDRLRGGGGLDTLLGGNGDDYLDGNLGNDFLRGGNGADELRGGRGRDTLFGGNGADTLRGGFGNDTVIGGAGNDYLVGGSGQNFVQGGDGADIFVLSQQGVAVITDFQESDQIRLGAGLQIETVSVEQDNVDTVITSGDNTIAILSNTQLEDVAARII